MGIKSRSLTFLEWCGLAAILIIVALFASEAGATPPKQKQHQEQAQKQMQQQTATATNANNQNLSVETGVSVSGGDNNFNYTASTAYAPQAWSQMTCSQVFGLAGQGQSRAWSLGLPVPRFLSKAIQDCEKERDASHLAQMGFYGAAIESLCGKRSMQDVHGGSAEACVNKFRGEVRQDDLLAEIDRLSKANTALLEERKNDLERLSECRERTDRVFQECVKK